MKIPHSIGIIGSKKNPYARTATKKLITFLKKRGVKHVIEKTFSVKGKTARAMNVDFAIVLGGDGTLLRACRELKSGTPVLRVNCGRHGALMDVERKDMLNAVEKVLEGKCKIEKRSRILAVVDGVKKPFALNEVELVTGKTGIAMEYSLSVNGKEKLRDRGDGVIIATPTGSTAHAYSAGGMKISPKKRVFEIVPINSMYNRGRVMAVPDNAKLSLSRFTKGSEVLIDGKVRVKAGKSVLLKKGEPALFLRPL